MSDDLLQRVYKLRYAEGYEWLVPVREIDVDSLQFDGRPRAGSWSPVRMRRVRISERGTKLTACDFPACSGGDMMILSREAVTRVGKQLLTCGELLPLQCDQGEFFALNVTAFVDVLDESRSDVLRASDTGEVLLIKTHAFLQSAAPLPLVFKVLQTPRGLIYSTQRFIDLVQEYDLSGLEFVQVWPAESEVSPRN